MGDRVESIIQKSISALERRDPALARQVIVDDVVIDRMENEIDERCLRLLALQQPLAGDLRFITGALKISNDLERVGDHAVNIAGGADRLAGLPPLKPLVDIPRLATLATGMLREALNAFVRHDAEAARQICRRCRAKAVSWCSERVKRFSRWKTSWPTNTTGRRNSFMRSRQMASSSSTRSVPSVQRYSG